VSAARKRSNTGKHAAEVDLLRQKLTLVQHHYSVMKCMAEALARKCDAGNIEFEKIEDDEVVTPQMDGYKMKCCGCGLVHEVRFRAVEVHAHQEDGTFLYEELDPDRYRVEFSMKRMSTEGGE